jgi:DNA-binding MarR family transcriptional regulator
MTPRIIYLIKRAEIEVTARMAKALEPYNLTPIQFTLLYFIDNAQGDLSSAQLSRRFSMTPQSMNELVQVLQQKKLLKKMADTANRRILRISLTQKGKQTLHSCNATLDSLEEELLKEVSEGDMVLLRNLLRSILETTREAVMTDK